MIASLLRWLRGSKEIESTPPDYEVLKGLDEVQVRERVKINNIREMRRKKDYSADFMPIPNPPTGNIDADLSSGAYRHRQPQRGRE